MKLEYVLNKKKGEVGKCPIMKTAVPLEQAEPATEIGKADFITVVRQLH